jgi:signal transduction histidine kinase
MKKLLITLILINLKAFAQETSVLINKKSFDLHPDSLVSIPANTHPLIIEINTTKDVFYRLYNFDNTYIKIKSNGLFNYTGLANGNYTLEVLNSEKKPIFQKKIIVEEPFWKKLPFLISSYVLIFLISGLVIYFFLLYKFRQQAKLQKVRNNIAADLHDDVGATLTSIGFFGELIRQKIINRAEPAEILPLLSKVIDSSKESVETMRGVVWTINPNNDFALDFFEKLKYYASEMLSTKQVELSFEVEGVGQQELSIEVQRNLFLFFKEAINNILKHAKAKTATVKIKMQSRRFWMEITDDGLGFDTNESFDGHGLGSLRKRIENLNGTLEIRSQKDDGTALEVTIFLP